MMVKNLRVVVKMEQVRGPRSVTVLKMNSWGGEGRLLRYSAGSHGRTASVSPPGPQHWRGQREAGLEGPPGVCR